MLVTPSIVGDLQQQRNGGNFLHTTPRNLAGCGMCISPSGRGGGCPGIPPPPEFPKINTEFSCYDWSNKYREDLISRGSTPPDLPRGSVLCTLCYLRSMVSPDHHHQTPPVHILPSFSEFYLLWCTYTRTAPWSSAHSIKPHPPRPWALGTHKAYGTLNMLIPGLDSIYTHTLFDI